MDAPQIRNRRTMANMQEGFSIAQNRSGLQQNGENRRLREENTKLTNELMHWRQVAKKQEDENKKQQQLLSARPSEPNLSYSRLEAERDELGVDREQLISRCKEMSIENSELKQHNKRYNSKMLQLNSALQTQQAKCAELQRAFDSKSDNFMELWKTWQDTVEELEEAKNSDEPYGVDDDVVVSKWKSLSYTIRCTAHQAFKTAAPRNMSVSLLPSNIQEASSRCKEYLSKKEQVPLILGAAIWRCINKSLQNPLRAYDTDAGRALHTLNTQTHKSNEEDFRKVQQWRSVTGEIFHATIGINETHRDLLSRELLRSLVPWNTLPMPEFHRCVQVMVDKTLELACIFARSKAYYRVLDGPAPKHHGGTADGFPMMAEYMEGCGGDHSGGQVVDLILSPALVKFGNCEGQDYDEYVILAKANVVCRR